MSNVRRLQFCLAVVLAAAVGAASAGEIVGKVKYAGTPPTPEPVKITKDQEVCAKTPQVESSFLVGADKGVKNVVVKITDPKDGAKMKAPAANASVDQNGCKFNPRIVIAAAGAPVDILNSDGILHNIHTWPKTNKAFNKAQPKFRKKMTETFPEPDVIRITCDVHSWMTGYIIVAEHPYYGLTDAAGSFTIAGVPAGTYTLEYWHEKLGSKTAKVTVPASGPVTADFEYPAQ